MQSPAMLAKLRQSLATSAASFGAVFRNRNLRRLELAWIGSITGEWGFGVALAVFAYQADGAKAVGFVAVARWVPSAIASPFLGTLGDRFRRERVLLGADLSRAAAMTGAAVAALSGAPPLVIYALAVFVSLASKTFRPAQAALVPALATTPEELTAANVASSAIESAGAFVGPAVAGLLLALTSPGVVFAATAGTFVWSALQVAGIRAPAVDAGRARGRHGILAGFSAMWRDADLRALVGLYAAQTVVAGAMNVLVVLTAIELLGLGRSGVGYLNSAAGVGGLVGAAAAFLLVGRRLATGFGLGIVLWGVALALIGLIPATAAADVLLGLIGVANTLVDVAGLTLLQRAVADELLGRVFGALEGLLVGTLALGAAVAPFLVDWIGIRAALVVTGALLPLSAAFVWRRLSRLDAVAKPPLERVEVLQALPLFAPLQPPVLERLAGRLEEVEVPAGREIFRQGDPGDRFYVVATGEVDVAVDGRPAAKIGPGGYFGEVALLRDVPRTATVRAAADSQLYALGRDDFLAAVAQGQSRAAADAVMGAYRLR